MFAKTIIDSDAFLDMPLSTQALYFHLSMRADDDGFVNNLKKIQRMLGCSDDDIKILLAKNFVIPFDGGVCVIKHWRVHNYIQKDRYKPTVYRELKDKLSIKDNGGYSMDTECIHDVSILEAQVRLGKDSLGKDKDIRVIVGFDEFWNIYDKKVGKPNAQKEWAKANIDNNLLKTVVEQAKKYAQTTEKKFRKDPERWIKYRGWEDEIIVIDQSKPKELPLGSDKQIEEAYRVECGGDPAKARFNSYFDMKKFILDQREKRARA